MILRVEVAHWLLMSLLRRARLSAWIAGVCLLGACESTDDGDNPVDEGEVDIVLQNENNYGSTTDLSIDTIETSVTDLEVCWAGVTDNLQCHDVDPAQTIHNVSFIRFKGLSEADVEAMLSATQLETSDVDVYFDYEPKSGETCAHLSDMEFGGTSLNVEDEYLEGDEYTYVLLFAETTVPGVGVQTMTFIKPTSDANTDTVNAPPGCTGKPILDFEADLTSLTNVEVPVDGPWVVGWKNVKKNGAGQNIDFDSIDGLLLGFYEGMTPTQIEDEFLDLEQIATVKWEADVQGRSADLAEAKECDSDGNCDGEAFPGFERDAEGTWLLALTCSECQSPAPVVLTILEPGSGS